MPYAMIVMKMKADMKAKKAMKATKADMKAQKAMKPLKAAMKATKTMKKAAARDEGPEGHEVSMGFVSGSSAPGLWWVRRLRCVGVCTLVERGLHDEPL